MVNKIQPAGEIVQEMVDEAFALLCSANKFTSSAKLWMLYIHIDTSNISVWGRSVNLPVWFHRYEGQPLLRPISSESNASRLSISAMLVIHGSSGSWYSSAPSP
jgi:hypothetical protein